MIEKWTVHAPQFNHKLLKQASRGRWLQRQIDKCNELLANPNISTENMKLVELLRTEFRQDMAVLSQRNDDDQSCC